MPSSVISPPTESSITIFFYISFRKMEHTTEVMRSRS
jgi:hypothetical protein